MRQNPDQFRGRNWKELYLAALFEDNKASVPRKIAEAQRAIAMRRSELLRPSGNDARERQALDTALFFLNALGACLGIPASLPA